MMLNRKSTNVNTEVSNQTPAISFINKPTKITGDINCDEDLRIAGTIEGEVHSKMKFILNESGVINGKVNSQEAEIAGKVNGDVRVKDKLTLKSTAVVEGKIYTKKISIEDGAQIKGSLHVGPNVSVEDTSSSMKTSSNTSDSTEKEKSNDKKSGSGKIFSKK
ncbi:bactofilin family protein [Gracilimonas sp. Q87]|uniref:bactofilin family protein n=1 Tax=Gracilimonas sp. Q87 TaxID=3384766 RepID=UPI003983F8E3